MPMPQGIPQGIPPGQDMGQGQGHIPQGIEPGQGIPPGQDMGQGQGQEMPPEQIKQQLNEMIKQLPPETIKQIVSMDSKQALQQLMQLFIQQGLDKPTSLNLAGLLYEAILQYAQTSTNSTVGMLNPNLMKKQQEAPQQGQPEIPTLRGR